MGNELFKGKRGVFETCFGYMRIFVYSISVIYLSCNVYNGKAKYDCNGILLVESERGDLDVRCEYN